MDPAFGAKKLGQPVPELNFVSLVQRAGSGALGRVLPQDLVLLRRQQLAPLVVGFLRWEIRHGIW